MSNNIPPRVHDLKILPAYFLQVVAGTKRFELRKNDRAFAVGDFLNLLYWDPTPTSFDVRGYAPKAWTTVRVTCMIDSIFGLKEGYVCMSITPVDRPVGDTPHPMRQSTAESWKDLSHWHRANVEVE